MDSGTHRPGSTGGPHGPEGPDCGDVARGSGLVPKN